MRGGKAMGAPHLKSGRIGAVEIRHGLGGAIVGLAKAPRKHGGIPAEHLLFSRLAEGLCLAWG